ncbi:uncharacterized protein N7459_005157 [Penicillium hispanicum]|uniref:uncharacterized protein n=1 Tax=Penicillium hispanicum TaxID=1080232 RepID=UPI0025424365|nr:uncharacterized protein N7459_005157 [Penicillium hispanicum]KAJ5585357.1 hypothetical protein N7459_005157 [Penicillium hispanicum]
MDSSGLSTSPTEGAHPTDDVSHANDDVNLVDTSQGADKLPSAETVRQAGSYEVLDREGKPHTFQSLYNEPSSASRVLVIFVRHFFCGNCQEFLRTFSEAVTPDDLVPLNTSVVIIGCGDPGLIDMYATESGCQFPIFADPTRKLYDEFEMITSLAWGARPKYMRKSMSRSIAESIVKALKQIPSGLVTKGGESSQNGGEFLFEVSGDGQEKQVTWCHRMGNTRDHTEVSELARILKVTQSQ